MGGAGERGAAPVVRRGDFRRRGCRRRRRADGDVSSLLAARGWLRGSSCIYTSTRTRRPHRERHGEIEGNGERGFNSHKSSDSLPPYPPNEERAIESPCTAQVL